MEGRLYIFVGIPESHNTILLDLAGFYAQEQLIPRLKYDDITKIISFARSTKSSLILKDILTLLKLASLAESVNIPVYTFSNKTLFRIKKINYDLEEIVTLP